MLVVIDGPDGSGKTTISEKLLEIIQNQNIKVEYRKLELGVKNLSLFNLLYRLGTSTHLLKAQTYNSYKKHYGEVLDGHLVPSFKEKLFSSFIIIDKALTCAFLKHLWRKKFVVVDSYIYDTLVPLLCRGLISASLFSRILSFRDIIRGDVEIFSDGPSDKLYERRLDDYGCIDFVDCNRKYFLVAAEKMESPVVYVDSPIDITINKVFDAILPQLPSYNKEEHLLHVFTDPFLSVEKRDAALSLFDFEKFNWNKILEIAENQKVLLPLLQNLVNLPLGKEIRNKLDNELVKTLDLREKRLYMIRNVLKTLNEDSINYAIFKSIPPYFSELDTDIDILIDANDVPKAVTLLKRNGWAQNYSIIHKNRLSKTLLFFYPELVLSKQGFEIDFHDRLVWGKLMVSPKTIKKILKIKEKALIDTLEAYTLPPEYEFIFTMAHALCKHSRINLWDMHAFRFFKDSPRFSLIYDASETLGYKLRCDLATFFSIYAIKNIFYWKDSIPNVNGLVTCIDAVSLRKCVAPAEISLSRLRDVFQSSGLEHEYHFIMKVASLVLKQPDWLCCLYKNKLK